MKTAKEISDLYHHRKEMQNPILKRMEEVRQLYNGDMVVPLPELDQSQKPGIANLLLQGIDQMGMRIASVMPDISYPPIRPGIQISEDKARDRRLANLGWWDMNQMQIILRQRARYLLAYGSSPVTLSPISPKVTDKRKMPFWRSRNPFSAFLPMPEIENDMEPSNGIFCHSQSRQWLEQRYPDQMRRLAKGDDAKPNDRFEVLEYHDAEETTLIVLGKEQESRLLDSYGRERAATGSPSEILEQVANKAEIPLVVCPGRIVLDRLLGYFDQLPGMYMKQAKLDALEYVSVKRSIYPTEWLVTHPTSLSQATIVTEATSVRGIRGEIKGGQIQTITLSPNQMVAPAIDRLERNARVTAGIPAEFGGESPTNIRTARRGSEVMSSTITMPIGEAQDIFAASLEAENVRAVALMRGNYKTVFFGFMQSRTGPTQDAKDYSPGETFETDLCYVKYAIPGTDASAIPIEIGQRVGTQEISLYTARRMDPVVEDPTFEDAQVTIEGLRKATVSGLEQQAAQGTFNPATVAYIVKEMLGKDKLTVEDAVIRIHEKKQKTQAAQSGGTPQQQPGLAPPTAQPGPQGPGGPIPPPNPNQANLAQVLQTLRRPANQGAAEKALT